MFVVFSDQETSGGDRLAINVNHIYCVVEGNETGRHGGDTRIFTMDVDPEPGEEHYYSINLPFGAVMERIREAK